MNRKDFINKFGIGIAASIIAPSLLKSEPTKVEQIKPAPQSKKLSWDELIPQIKKLIIYDDDGNAYFKVVGAENFDEYLNPL